MDCENGLECDQVKVVPETDAAPPTTGGEIEYAASVEVGSIPSLNPTETPAKSGTSIDPFAGDVSVTTGGVGPEDFVVKVKLKFAGRFTPEALFAVEARRTVYKVDGWKELLWVKLRSVTPP